MLKNPIISFCIPTYNRVGKVFELVSNILKHEGSDIEVLVLDNCSTDGTKVLLEKIQDSRFKFIQNEKNIGGIKNPYKALSLAKGDFCFLCLDKDYVNPKYINELVAKLTVDNDVVFGHCELDNKKNSSDIVYDKGFQSILNMSYLSAHPSGMFYKKDIFIKSDILKDIFNSDKIFGFGFELINAEMSLKGKSLQIGLPVFTVESREECANTASYTYKNANDVFFSPKGRFNEFYTYTKHLYGLDICLNEKRIILKKLLRQGLMSATFGYRDIMKDISICSHYHLKSLNISSIELIKIYWNFTFSFFISDLPISLLNRILLFFSVNLRLFYSLFGNKISSNYGK